MESLLMRTMMIIYSMMENTQIINSMVKEFLNLKMEINMKVGLLITNSKEKEN